MMDDDGGADAIVDRVGYEARIAALRADNDAETLTRLAYAMARRLPRLALSVLLPTEDETALDQLLADPGLSIENQQPWPSKMARPSAPLELRLHRDGTELIVWSPAETRLIDAVVRAAGSALTRLHLHVEDADAWWSGLDRRRLRHVDSWTADPARLRALLDGADHLESLSIRGEAFAGLLLPALRSLRLSTGTLTVAEASALARCPDFAELTCHAHTGQDTVIALGDLRGLTSLFLSESDCGDAGATALARCAALRSLYVADGKVGDRGAEALAGLGELTTLGLARNQIGDSGAIAIAAMPRLERLHLDGNRISSIGAGAIARMQGLRALDLGENQIDDVGARALASLPPLESLKLVGNPITDLAGVRAALRPLTLDLILDDEDEFWSRVP